MQVKCFYQCPCNPRECLVSSQGVQIFSVFFFSSNSSNSNLERKNISIGTEKRKKKLWHFCLPYNEQNSLLECKDIHKNIELWVFCDSFFIWTKEPLKSNAKSDKLLGQYASSWYLTIWPQLTICVMYCCETHISRVNLSAPFCGQCPPVSYFKCVHLILINKQNF